jgi:FAD/FMN-containing dehydrogenase
MASSIEQLGERVRGEVITPDHPGYDEARKVLNGMIDRRPRAIVRATGAEDVAAAVNFARENSLDLATRGGGHSVPGFGTVDDVVIDLSLMRSVSVDPERKTARAQGGATWGDFNDATNVHGLATTGASSRPPGWAGSRSGEASDTSPAVSVCPATT